MNFSVQPSPLPGAGVAPPPSPVAPTASAVGPALTMSIGRIELEGFGAISGSAVRQGFLDHWTRNARKNTDWEHDVSRHFAQALQINVSPSLGGRELGRKIAAAILQRVQNVNPDAE